MFAFFQAFDCNARKIKRRVSPAMEPILKLIRVLRGKAAFRNLLAMALKGLLAGRCPA